MDKLRIYFSGSIRGGRGDQKLYADLIGHLRTRGKVLTEHIGDPGLTPEGEEGLSEAEIYDRDMSWIGEADAVVAEVTTPSLGVGYEIAAAESLRKPTLCLFRPAAAGPLSAMIAGSRRSTVRTYETVEEAADAIDDFLASILPR